MTQLFQCFCVKSFNQLMFDTIKDTDPPYDIHATKKGSANALPKMVERRGFEGAGHFGESENR